MERKLFEASVSGCVNTLNALIREDELILDRVLVTSCFHETPLHIAALRGHLDFSRALLSLKPKLATELDSQGHSPLHLASVEGYVEIVQELLQVSPHMCHVRNQDGRTPLHLAVMKGRAEVIKELIQARPKSIWETIGYGETILHLSIHYNRLEALKLLVEWARDDDKFVNSKDDYGNTILHNAAILKQEEVRRWLTNFKRKC
ncbi:hypothetical protein L1049_013414 [Liquidambar formosana]|uniref:Ankyrin repeat-containing protein BDA1-like n=1 Tax=Liquidambar formosana TaxID=63359 RepID=A0AAP0RKH3_LIQFO